MNKKSKYLVLGLEIFLALMILSRVSASNFQPVIVTSNTSFMNLSIMVCSTNTTTCSDIWIQNFTFTSNATQRVVILEGYNSSLNSAYYFSAYTDGGILLYNNTKSYLGRGDVVIGNFTVVGYLNVTDTIVENGTRVSAREAWNNITKNSNDIIANNASAFGRLNETAWVIARIPACINGTNGDVVIGNTTGVNCIW
jgi:hypothetical protein